MTAGGLSVTRRLPDQGRQAELLALRLPAVTGGRIAHLQAAMHTSELGSIEGGAVATEALNLDGYRQSCR